MTNAIGAIAKAPANEASFCVLVPREKMMVMLKQLQHRLMASHPQLH